MVSDILYYAKDREPVWESVSAHELGRETCGLVQPRADEHAVRLIQELPESTGNFEADPRAVRSLLVNLLENSIDACRLDRKKTDHSVALRLAGTPERIEFEVQDNGIGMDAETRDKAFSLFFSSKGSEGTGLGLFIANRIARAHGGIIELESEAGAGTRFLVRLPRKRPSHQHQTDDLSTSNPETCHG